MDKKLLITIIGIPLFIIVVLSLVNLLTKTEEKNTLEATILTKSNNSITLQDKDNIIYTFKNNNIDTEIGKNIVLEYTGLLDKNNEHQNIDITKYNAVTTLNETSSLPDDNGMFQKYYDLAYNKVKDMTLDEKIAQLLIVQYPSNDQVNILKQYQFGGYLFFEKDFANKTKDEVNEMINKLQEVADIPILTVVDEEGGKVVRISSNSNLRSEKFKSPSELYAEGGFELIKTDTIEKSNLLKNLGINLNLAPVVDVTTDSTAYMYDRTLKEDATLTATYAKTVIDASKDTGVSYTLKHFPGYGNNTDTHIGNATDNRTYEEILNNDLLPFKSGINAGAEAVLVSHNTVMAIDSDNPASLSSSVHNLLRNELGFTGIIITDDISMDALDNIDKKAVLALQSGNDLIITSDYLDDINKIKEAINNNTISTNLIDKLATRVIAWKYYKGLMYENQK